MCWASSNGAYDDGGLVDAAYRQLLAVRPALGEHVQLPSARAAALRKTPSSAASDVVSDGTHMDGAGLQSWQGDQDESGSGGPGAQDGGAEPVLLGQGGEGWPAAGQGGGHPAGEGDDDEQASL